MGEVDIRFQIPITRSIFCRWVHLTLFRPVCMLFWDLMQLMFFLHMRSDQNPCRFVLIILGLILASHIGAHDKNN